VHETLTVHKTSNDVVLRGISSTEASWFPGWVASHKDQDYKRKSLKFCISFRYSWTIAECRSCSSHLGWKFKALGRLKPSKFYGLARRSISFKYNIFREEENDYLY
jgi:cereblon